MNQMIEHYLRVDYDGEYQWEWEGLFPKILEVGDVIETRLDFSPSERQGDCVDEKDQPIEQMAGELVSCRCRVTEVVYGELGDDGTFWPEVVLKLEKIQHKKFGYMWVRVDSKTAWRSDVDDRDIVVTLSHKKTKENPDAPLPQ